MKSQRKTFADIIAGFIGKPFEEGATGPDSYDCFGLLYAYRKATGKELRLRTSAEGYTHKNYREMSPDEIDGFLLRQFGTSGNCEEVTVGSQIAGDSMLLKTKRSHLFVGICAGNGNFVSSVKDVGVKVFKLDPEIFEVVRVRRQH